MATGNEDLFAFGYDAENYGKPSGHQQGYWGGDQGEVAYGENGFTEVRPTGVQQDVNRYRQMGQGMADRSAYRGNYADFNEASGGFSYGQGRARSAMDLQQAAAEGRAPSAAEIAGKSAIDQSLTAQQSAAASTRGGPLAQAAATRDARNGANAFRQTAVQGIQAGRANEMANARNSYAGSTFQYGQNQMGQQQLQLGKTQQEIQAEQFQRQLNQQGQQWAENKAFDTKSQGLASDFARQGQQFQSLQADRQNNMAERQQDFNEIVGSVNAGTNTGSTVGKLGTQASDARAKLPVSRDPYGKGDGLEVSSEDSYDSDEWERDRENDRLDIQRRDPYEADQDEMLSDRQRQNGQQAPAEWLNAYVEKDQAPPPARAQQPKPKMSYEAGWADTAQDDDDRGVAPGTTDLDKYAYSDAVTKIVGKVNEFFSEKKGLDTASSPSKKHDPTKSDFDQAPPREAPDARTASMDKTFRRDSTQDQKKVRRTFENKASKDADDMMAGMQKSLEQGSSVAAKAAGTRADRVAVDLDEPEDGRVVYSDKEAKKAAFEAGKRAQAQKPAPKGIEPITVEGRPRDYEKAGVPTGPSAQDDEVFNLYSQGRGPISPEKYMENVEGSERWEDSVRAARDKPANLQGDAYVPPAFQPPAPRRRTEEEGMAYSDERTKTEAAHALEGQDYKYKDEFTPPEQEEGEINHGPMAQNMEKNPLTRTAVKKDPRGMRMVDMNKLVKVHSSLIDHLQDEIEDLKGVRNG